jgi:hypothetical protein
LPLWAFFTRAHLVFRTQCLERRVPSFVLQSSLLLWSGRSHITQVLFLIASLIIFLVKEASPLIKFNCMKDEKEKSESGSTKDEKISRKSSI